MKFAILYQYLLCVMLTICQGLVLFFNMQSFACNFRNSEVAVEMSHITYYSLNLLKLSMLSTKFISLTLNQFTIMHFPQMIVDQNLLQFNIVSFYCTNSMSALLLLGRKWRRLFLRLLRIHCFLQVLQCTAKVSFPIYKFSCKLIIIF